MAFSATAASAASMTATGSARIRSSDLHSTMLGMPVKQSRVAFQRKPKLLKSDLSVRARHNGHTGGDLLAAFLGGALVGALTVAYYPQIRKAILHEDEHAIRRSRRPVYYDVESLAISQTLSFKLRQLIRSIDKMSAKLRSGFKLVREPNMMPDSEIEAAA